MESVGFLVPSMREPDARHQLAAEAGHCRERPHSPPPGAPQALPEIDTVYGGVCPRVNPPVVAGEFRQPARYHGIGAARRHRRGPLAIRLLEVLHREAPHLAEFPSVLGSRGTSGAGNPLRQAVRAQETALREPLRARAAPSSGRRVVRTTAGDHGGRRPHAAPQSAGARYRSGRRGARRHRPLVSPGGPAPRADRCGRAAPARRRRVAARESA